MHTPFSNEAWGFHWQDWNHNWTNRERNWEYYMPALLPKIFAPSSDPRKKEKNSSSALIQSQAPGQQIAAMMLVT